ncbi:MAG: aminotransferase class III-fold pyridoxal phosphate-dependent enzyme [Anaerolineales bacterium]|nr:aminotransferase class III-fold pyridoxal phosphate-dependent enzyme [Anaerolineales bacterium]
MQQRDYKPLLTALTEAYERHAPRSAALNQRARQVLVDGGSHAMRLIEPFPPRIVDARGAWLTDEDGHRILDFWQGHFANLLGHNPTVVTTELAHAFEGGFGLQTGFTDLLQIELAEILCRQTGAERVRFTTSGSLATMYAVLLARAFTGRSLVMKVGGGWHGAQPWALKGVDIRIHPGHDRVHIDSQGLPAAVTEEVVVTGFNDVELLHDCFKRYGHRLACFIVEPFIGAGGFLFATPEYLRAARTLTQEYGVVLILDEVISGFRFRAGDLASLYGVRADLATYGKVIGGGMPVSAVAGRADIMALAGREGGSRVKFSGGTYSGHPASMLAGKALLTHLVAHEQEVYGTLSALGEEMRQTMEEVFSQRGLLARCTGYGNEAVSGSSLFRIHFPYRDDLSLTRPEDIFNPALCDLTLSDHVLQLALLLEDIHLVQGRGALTTAHTPADIARFGEACDRVAERVAAAL